MKKLLKDLLFYSALIPLLSIIIYLLMTVILGPSPVVGLGVAFLYFVGQWGFLMIVFSIAYCVDGPNEELNKKEKVPEV